MPKKYDFRFVIRAASFNRGMVSVPYGRADDVYREECQEMTLAEALAHREKISQEEPRSHAAFLSMKYRDDRKPAGFAKVATLYHNADEARP